MQCQFLFKCLVPGFLGCWQHEPHIHLERARAFSLSKKPFMFHLTVQEQSPYCMQICATKHPIKKNEKQFWKAMTFAQRSCRRKRVLNVFFCCHAFHPNFSPRCFLICSLARGKQLRGQKQLIGKKLSAHTSCLKSQPPKTAWSKFSSLE